MTTTLERLRAALLPDFEIERELAGGGMGRVFLARDVTLERPVAVKIVRPELATARAAEQFLTEARTLARLRHPNVVPVHRAGEAAGFLYYVMDFVEGETLADRLRRAPLDMDAALALGRDILDALEAVHGAGLVHRDIKPSNIFFSDERALLGDFGISAPTEVAAKSSEDARAAGTPGYMPPEQSFGWGSTPASDLYAVGMVLYEAITGRRWEYLLPDQTPDWAGVPRQLVPILRRATEWEPARRWASAADFRQALWRTRTRRYRRRAALLGVGGLAVGIAAAVLLLRPAGPELKDLAILPFTVEPGLNPNWRADLPALIDQSVNLPGVLPPNTTLLEVSKLEGDTAAWFGPLGARALLAGSVRRAAGAFEIQFSIEDRRGGHRESEPIRVDSIETAGCRLGSEVVHLVWPDRATDYRCPPWLQGTRAREEVTTFLAGERAFRRQAWDSAEVYFDSVLRLDSSFALAAWRRATALTWQRKFTGVDLDTLYKRHGDELGELDRLLLNAWRTPFGPARLAMYQTAVSPTKYGRDPYAWLTYSDDLFNRGALMGIPLDSSRRVVAHATTVDSTLGPAFIDMAWAAIRLGDTATAARAVQRLAEISPEGAVIPPEYFGLAYSLRFEPHAAEAFLAKLTSGGRWTPEIDMFDSTALRWGLSFDLMNAETDYATGLLGLEDVPRERRVDLLVARGLGLFATGHPIAALASFDLVTAVVDTIQRDEARLQAAQWRVIPAALGIPGIPKGAVEHGRSALETLSRASGAVGMRSAWTLAVDALARSDTAAAAAWADSVRTVDDSSAADLTGVLRAIAAARQGRYADAIAVSDSLVPRVAARGVPDPFYRTVIHLKRGAWRRQLGAAPDSDWIWYQNTDIDRWPGGLQQAGEVDWAVGVHARYVLGNDRLAHGDKVGGCRLLRRVAEIWNAVEPSMTATRGALGRTLQERCRP